MITPLLRPDALAGRRLGLSASESPDLARLGLTEKHLRLALAEMTRAVLTGGGCLAWGGHLKPDGLTPMLIDEVRRYGRKDGKSILVCLAWSEHRSIPRAEVNKAKDALGRFGKVVCLDLQGNEVEPEDSCPVTDPSDIARGLTAMRKYMVQHIDGRLMIGGKRSGFLGRLPGLIEEALMTLEADQPLYLAAGFGGATADIAAAAGLDMSWLPPDSANPILDPKLIAGLEELKKMVITHPQRTELEDDDLVSLTITHRPSEIATIVSRGLGKYFTKR